ncbi:MAG: DEAD/DEAH box helicase, partial [Acidimicrobiales bacterium]
MVEVLERKLITEPFEIQTLTIPDALVGRDILGRAPTGSGKTLAFGLPMLARLERGSKKLPRALVLSPTRELAEQICRELEPLAKAMDRSVLSVYGGVGLDRQIKALRKGVDVLVACPGRLLDLINQRAVRLDEVDIVVVDEADRMADMGFLPDVRKLLDQTSQDRQTLLFSATLDKDVQVLIDKYQHDPVVHEVGEVEPDLSIVDHRFIKVKKTDRVWLAADLIDDAGPTVIFVRTRHGVDRLARQLKAEGIKAGYIHGGRSQSQRDRALSVFIAGKVDALVATDVAARGIHVDGVACVIHFDPPADIKDYVHRSGRTARAGAEGMVVSFLDGPQVKESQKMQRRLALEAGVESPPARKPRSSRPASFDDRELDTPTRTRSKRNGNGAGRSGGSNRSKPAS